MNDKWLDFAIRIQSIAQVGLQYGKDAYDKERYEELRRISAEMISEKTDIPTEKVGAFDTELVQEFWTAFARCAGVTVHLRRLDGENSHHIIEGAFKAMARALRTAAAVDPSLDGAVPSTKGSL